MNMKGTTEQNGAGKLDNEIKRLQAAVEELSILNDISTAISSTMSLEQIIELIVRKCIKHLRVQQCTVTLLEPEDNEGPFRTMIREADTSKEVIPYHLDTHLAGWMIKNQKPLLINNFIQHEEFKNLYSDDFPVKSLLSAPLCMKGLIIGSINVFNKKTEVGFKESDKRLLSIIASQSAQVIENARLYREEQALRTMQEEMRLAYRIQMDLLPKEPPEIQGYDISGKSIPAKSVGGDYFDFIPIDDEHLAFCLGDISGKGMPAALLMSNLQATLRGQTGQNLSPKECLNKSNSLLFKSTDDARFATLFYGILDNHRHEFSYANAGHNYPFLIRTGKAYNRLELGGLVLGAIEEFSYNEDRAALEPGDMLLIFSDGVSEALNKNGDEFGEEIIAEIVQANIDKSSAGIIDAIIGAVHHHTEGMSQADDITLVAIKRIN